MKKVLVTGAGGAIGVHVIKYLLSEGNYEITALDLKNKRVMNNLKRYRKRINIVYGDVCDRILMEALVKGHDTIIHLASSMPPLADMKKGLANIIDYNGTENISRAISYYNPKCHLFYASTTSLYKTKENCDVKSKIVLEEYDYFNLAKYNAEQIIKEKVKNYTIYRLPLVLTNLKKENFMYHVKKNTLVDVITKEDAAYAFVRGIKYQKELNHQTFNVVGSEPILYKDLLSKILSNYGLSFKYVFCRLFLEKNYYSSVVKDRDVLENIIHYRNDSLKEYFNRLRSWARKRNIPRFLARPLIGD